MADITQIKTNLYLGQPTTPDNQKLLLAQAISSTATTLVTNFEPKDEDGASITDEIYIGIIRNDGFLETCLVTGISGTTMTLTRGIDPAGLDLTTGNSSFAASHSAGEPIIFNIPAVFVKMLYEYTKGNIAGGLKLNAATTFTGAGIIQVPIYADSTARDAAITSPANGMICYQTDEGTLMQYISGAWANAATGTTPNASTTVAGKVEIATDAEVTAGTGTGGTGAALATTPTQAQKSISLVASDTASDETDYYTFQDAAASDVNKRILKSDLRDDLAASTTVKGTSELATDAEAMAGADTERHTNSSQLALLRTKAILQTSRLSSTASSSVTIAHGLGYAPTSIELHCKYLGSGATIQSLSSDGFSNGTSNKCTYIAQNGDQTIAIANSSTACVYASLGDGGGSGDDRRIVTVTASFDATNVTLAYTKSEPDGAYSGIDYTMYITLLVNQ